MSNVGFIFIQLIQGNDKGVAVQFIVFRSGEWVRTVNGGFERLAKCRAAIAGQAENVNDAACGTDAWRMVPDMPKRSDGLFQLPLILRLMALFHAARAVLRSRNWGLRQRAAGGAAGIFFGSFAFGFGGFPCFALCREFGFFLVGFFTGKGFGFGFGLGFGGFLGFGFGAWLRRRLLLWPLAFSSARASAAALAFSSARASAFASSAALARASAFARAFLSARAWPRLPLQLWRGWRLSLFCVRRLVLPLFFG